jgi:hypothetical protein
MVLSSLRNVEGTFVGVELEFPFRFEGETGFGGGLFLL